MALEALASVNDGELSPEGIGLATISVEDELFTQHGNNGKTAYLEEAGLLADGEE